MPSETPNSSARGMEGLSFAGELRQSLSSSALLVDGSFEAAAMTPGTARWLGFEPAAGQSVAFGRLPAALQEAAREAAASGRPVSRDEVECKRPSGEVLKFSLSAIPLTAGKSPAGVALMLNDLGPARRVEAHLEELDRLANLGIMAASLAHEIKNALVAGKTFMDLLLEQHRGAELVEVVRREIDRIDTIVTRMLKFGGASRAAFSEVSLHELLEHSLRLIQHRAETHAITLNRSFQAKHDRLLGDDYELQQAFVNLLLNALDAMGENGTLTVSTEETAGAPPGRSGSPLWLRVAIHDSGIGILPEHMGRLFEPFFTTKESGTGLGLPITRRIIQRHRGDITARSQPGKGTTFEILLPASRP